MISKKGIFFFFFTFVLFITPSLPMPTSALGPIGPGLYLLLIMLYFFFEKDIKPFVYRNAYFKQMLVLTVILLLSDILKLVLFDLKYELNFVIVRIVNFGIFFIYGQMLLSQYDDGNNLKLDNFYLKVYFYSILFVSLILYAQAFGLLRVGEVFDGRTYFGLKLPFKKPVGLFELSDGKLGIMIAPLIYLSLLSVYKKISFFKIRFDILLSIVMFVLLVLLQSRSGYLAFMVSFVVFVFLLPSKTIRWSFIGSSIAVLILLIISGFYKLIWAGLVGEGIYEKNVDARGDVLAHTINSFLKNPLYGLGHKGVILQKSPFSSHGVGLHNLFSDHLASGGLIAFLPFVGLFVVFFYYNLKSYFLALKTKNYPVVGFSIWLIVSMVYIIIELFFYRGFYNEYLYFFLALGTISYLNQQQLTNEKNIAHS